MEICNCIYCQYSKRIEALKPLMSKETYELVKDLFYEWESTDAQLCWNMPKVEVFNILFSECEDHIEFRDHLQSIQPQISKYRRKHYEPN